ncbi:GIN domain-containing protein [Sphingomonas sp.]|uniref:GIN domain-containing protein n=1 Tax=Sphingomonas sp. TaxID=28214 RepID=UPI0035C816C9
MAQLRALAPLFLLAAATPAHAAERVWNIASFDRVRVDGPFEVRIATGASPRARASAADPALLDRLRLNVEGGTLSLRLDRGTDDYARSGATRGADGPPVFTLSTVALKGVTLLSGARVTVPRMSGARLDLGVTGTGSLSVDEASAEQVNATVIGSGSIRLAGRAGKARLVTNGPGTIDADALSAGELFVSLDGSGETRAAARYSAEIASTGMGRVTVSGTPKCTVRAAAGGPVSCGVLPAR